MTTQERLLTVAAIARKIRTEGPESIDLHKANCSLGTRSRHLCGAEMLCMALNGVHSRLNSIGYKRADPTVIAATHAELQEIGFISPSLFAQQRKPASKTSVQRAIADIAAKL